MGEKIGECIYLDKKDELSNKPRNSSIQDLFNFFKKNLDDKIEDFHVMSNSEGQHTINFSIHKKGSCQDMMCFSLKRENEFSDVRLSTYKK